MILKQFYFFKFINSNFGTLVSVFMNELHDPSEYIERAKFGGILRGSSRGKLDALGMRIFSVEFITDRYAILIFLWFLGGYFGWKIRRIQIEIDYCRSKETK